MILRIFHETRYSYEEDVFLEPHVLRFKARSAAYIRLTSFKTDIYPQPSGRSENFDVENNYNLACWFEDTHSDLTIRTETILETTPFNPFNFLIYPSGYNHLPFQYGELDRSLLKPALHSDFDLSTLTPYIERIKTDCGHDTLQFITTLTRKIHSDFVVESRDEGSPLEPSVTFESKKGSCRDLSWMLIHVLRQSGIASRYVSGYFFVSPEDSHFELHAWVEVFIPGAGWIGFDPSHGMITGHLHIPLASSAFFEKTMPVSGTSRGNAKGILHTKLNIEAT